MEFYLKELIDANKNNNACICIDFHGEKLLFETLELCLQKQFLLWIYKKFDNEEDISKINLLACTTYVDMKREYGLTNGEIRYTIICESSTKLLELILSKIYRDKLTFKQVWLAIFRLKQNLSMTSLQKRYF